MKKPKIAYIEIDTHPEIVQNFMELTLFSRDFEIDFYLSEKILKQINPIQQNIFVVSPENLLSELEKQNYNLIIIGTAHRYFHIFKKIIKKQSATIIVHNINFSKSSKLSLFKNIFKEEVVFRLKLLLKEGLLSAPNLYKNVSKTFVLGKSLATEGRIFLPVFYSEKLSGKPKTTGKIRIVIPGAVSQKRRDYLHILKRIKTFKLNAEIIFCGKASSAEHSWLKEAQKHLPANLKIKFFSTKLSRETFDQIMASADVLWCPIQEKTTFMSVEETYGKTKISGNTGDAIRYQKPAIFPKGYESPLPFIFEEKEDIETQILEIINTPLDFNDYSQEKVASALAALLKNSF